ncbi:MAG: type II secretion system F family protein [Clostridiaceae bacterium]|nr:type II secretion system F family protein [Clostridiaceae bacterium]
MAQDKKYRLESVELAWLCEQIALIQKSGIPLPEGIELLAESADLPGQAGILEALAAEMRKMIPLSEAMEALRSFPEYLIKMVKVGEVSGNLDHVLHSLAEYYTRDAELKRKVRSTLVYPVILLLMMLAIIVLLVVRVLPVFSEILASFGGTMPPLSQGLLSLARFVSQQAIWLIPLIVIVVVGLVLWFRRSKTGHRLLDRARLKLPILGPLYQRIYTSRFSTSLSYMLSSGIDLDSALMMTEAVMENTLVSERIAVCREEIRRGEDLFAALKATNLFPSLFVRMLALGNQTGEMDAVMGKIARTYENEVDNRLTRLTGLIEPLLVLILSLIVGGILLTVMLPLVEIMSSIG